MKGTQYFSLKQMSCVVSFILNESCFTILILESVM